MSIVTVERSEWIASTVGAVTNGTPFKVDGQAWSIQTLLAPVNFTFQVSNDCFNWINATDVAGAAMAAIGAGVWAESRDHPEWIRAQVAADAGGPQDCIWLLIVRKDI